MSTTDLSAIDSPILVLMGVMGSGKTTAAQRLAQHLGWDYAEADAFHPAANIAKMSASEPLTDADRWPWLASMAAWISEHTANGRPAVVTCSALKRSYRDVLRGPQVIFVHMAGSRETIAARVELRSGHFMPLSLLDSQFDTLEVPGDDEQVVTIDLDLGRSPEEEALEVVRVLHLTPTEAIRASTEPTPNQSSTSPR